VDFHRFHSSFFGVVNARNKLRDANINRKAVQKSPFLSKQHAVRAFEPRTISHLSASQIISM
jgi:hypothetical protein